jgi:hypothetical protein
MRVLITGYLARSANPDYRRRLGVANLLEHTLRTGGHEVIRDYWRPGDPRVLRDFDLVIVGLHSPLAAVSSYAFSAMFVLERLWGDDRLVVFPEDAATWKIKNGNLSAIRMKDRMFSPFLAKRVDFARVATSEMRRAKMIRACALLSSVDWWPRYLVPAFKDAEPGLLLRLAPHGAALRPVPIDLTQCYPVKLEPDGAVRVRDEWIVDVDPAQDRQLKTVITAGPKRRVTAFDDRILAQHISRGLGIIQHNVVDVKLPGAWNSTVGIAAQVGAFYFGPEKTHKHWGDAYRVLPTAFEELPEPARVELVDWQRETLAKVTATPEEALTVLEGLR